MATQLGVWLVGKGLSQRRVAEVLDISPNAVSKHLAGGKLSLDTGMKYHRRLGVPLDLLEKHPEVLVEEKKKGGIGIPREAPPESSALDPS